MRDISCDDAITLTGVPLGMYPDEMNTGVLTTAGVPFFL